MSDPKRKRRWRIDAIADDGGHVWLLPALELHHVPGQAIALIGRWLMFAVGIEWNLSRKDRADEDRPGA